MIVLGRFARRVWHLVHRRRFERDLAREMASHRAQMDDPRRFGNGLRLREQNADVWGWTWIDDLARDLRFGLRQLIKTPRMTIAAIGILALGTGVPLALLHLANAVGRYMYTVPDADRLVRIAGRSPRFASSHSPAAVSFYREHTKTFAFLAAENRGWYVSLAEDPEPLPAVFVSDSYFQDLRMTPLHGRLLETRDSSPSAEPVAVLGESYWRRAFGADPGIINRAVRVNGTLVRIVGVVRRTFDGLAPPGAPVGALWLPLATRPAIIESSPSLDDVTRADMRIYGRLTLDATPAAAAAELSALTADLQRRHDNRAEVPEAFSVAPVLDGLRFEADVAVLFVLFFLIFFSACANLGNLLLARGLGRSREIEVRVALGASRGRVVRHLLTENLVLATLGCVVGTFLGYLGARALMAALGDMPPGLHVAIDGRMLFISAVMVLLAVPAFGLAPAIQAVRRRHAGTRARQTLIAVQVAASCVLLIVSALLARGSDRFRAAAPAFDFTRTIVLDPQLTGRTLTADAQRATLDGIAARLERLPGVAAVAAGRPGRFTLGQPQLLFQEVTPAYFDVVALPLVRGRLFASDEANAMIVSQSAAAAVWPGREPLGQTWTSGRGRFFVVVGVVRDSGLAARGNRAAGEAYIPVSENSWPHTVVFARTNGNPHELLLNGRRAAAQAGVMPTTTMMADTLELEPRSMVNVFAGLGFIAILLAFAGIYTLVGFTVAQRTREIGVRIALGARRTHVLVTLLGQYRTPLAAGAIAGLGLAVGATQVLRRELYGLTPLDPLSHLAGLSGVALVALLAIMLPARRALRIDPSTALRAE